MMGWIPDEKLATGRSEEVSVPCEEREGEKAKLKQSYTARHERDGEGRGGKERVWKELKRSKAEEEEDPNRSGVDKQEKTSE
ncbi:hypothetical protein AXG93_392s1570 [Marchantia polymorpha subsp. ruderalis]|uniref:Uncharacterized protein n=1 Tax=Marchantia polymorpha subsp. ruderalis TaxID=1480154 RepID=A0A176WQA6_MARPO|nr:hypothetical protein AXG93_392s1570 [Marchantia polymorpha subsp. ruderalis]